MTTKHQQKLVNKWINIYKKQSDSHLIEIYKDEFKNNTPRRDEDKARKKAIEALIMTKAIEEAEGK